MNKPRLPLILLACLLAGPVMGQHRGGVGRLITSVGKLASCIAPVEVYEIDGRPIMEGKHMISLSAGEHVVKARATVDLGICVHIRRSASRATIDPITINIETGKDYYLGLDVDPPRRKDWKLVVWKVKGDAFEGTN